MTKLSLLGLAGALALPLAFGPPAAAAGPMVIDRAVGDQAPFVLTWVGTAGGQVGVDDQLAAQTASLVAGATYLFTDQGALLVGQFQGPEFRPIAPPLAALPHPARLVFAGQERSRAQTLFLDATVTRAAPDGAQGVVRWNLLLLGRDGSSTRTVIEQELLFQSGGTPIALPPIGSRFSIQGSRSNLTSTSGGFSIQQSRPSNLTSTSGGFSIQASRPATITNTSGGFSIQASRPSTLTNTSGG